MPVKNKRGGGADGAENSPFRLQLVIWGILLSIILYLFGNVFLGLVYYLTTLAEETLPWLSGALYFGSIFTGAAVVTRRAGGKALFYGLAIAGIFFLLAWGLGSTVLPLASCSSPLAPKLFLALSAGVLGSILGIATAT